MQYLRIAPDACFRNLYGETARPWGSSPAKSAGKVTLVSRRMHPVTSGKVPEPRQTRQNVLVMFVACALMTEEKNLVPGQPSFLHPIARLGVSQAKVPHRAPYHSWAVGRGPCVS